MARKRASLDEIKRFYATLMAAASESDDPRLERVFELVPREAFVPAGPWQIWIKDRYVVTPNADPMYLYQDALVALDASKGINNGQPSLHAAWIGAVAPRSGDAICHIGAGMGYYTAILSVLALPGGRVEAFEIEPKLAARASENLRAFDNAAVIHGDATRSPLPRSDLIYVNAGVAVPPVRWLDALRPRGRMIFPWRPSEEVGLTLIVSREAAGFKVTPLMRAWFIPCVGAGEGERCTLVPKSADASSVRSVWLRADKPPDATAVAICEDVWFSSALLP